MGFKEDGHLQVQDKIILGNGNITSKVNNKTYRYGILEMPSVGQLVERNTFNFDNKNYNAHISQYIGDIQEIHQDKDNATAIFQVASQFNLLEMAGPEKTPELGVGLYDFDYTQGPACAIACGAGTIYRNYLVPHNGKRGQYRDSQINCLSGVDAALNVGRTPWKMMNGYAMLTEAELNDVNNILSQLDEDSISNIKDKLNVGIQWSTEVTLNDVGHLVNQVYSSALPVAYNNFDSKLWEPLAKLVLEGTYEATLYAGLLNIRQGNSNKVFLTLVGGGAFGNSMQWITEVLIKVLRKFKNTPLDIRIVSHENFNPIVNEIIKKVWE